MAENWGMILLTIAVSVLGYIIKNNDNHARERQEKSDKMHTDAINTLKHAVDKIASALGEYVKKDDCTADMGQHCNQLSKLEDSIKDNTQRIAVLETSVSLYHKNKD